MGVGQSGVAPVSVRIRTLPELKVARTFVGAVGAARGLAFLDETRLASWEQGGTVRVWKWRE